MTETNQPQDQPETQETETSDTNTEGLYVNVPPPFGWGGMTEDQIGQLMSPLNRARVKNRRQGSATLSYLEAWDVRATLIRIFGFGNFSVETVDTKTLYQEQVPVMRDGAPTGNSHWVISREATVRLTIPTFGVTYTESAVSSQKGPDYGEVSDFALKTAQSDALKRAAVNLGTQFGLSLYNDGNTADVVRVLLDPYQRSQYESYMKKMQARMKNSESA